MNENEIELLIIKILKTTYNSDDFLLSKYKNMVKD